MDSFTVQMPADAYYAKPEEKHMPSDPEKAEQACNPEVAADPMATTPPSPPTGVHAAVANAGCAALHMPMIVLDIATVVFSIIALSCMGAAIKSDWTGADSHTSFALFTGITSIFLSAGFVAAHIVLARGNGDPHKNLIIADIAYHFIWAVFWFATGCDIAVQVGKLSDYSSLSVMLFDFGVLMSSNAMALLRTYTAFAFFAFFACLAALVVAAISFRRATRD